MSCLVVQVHVECMLKQCMYTTYILATWFLPCDLNDSFEHYLLTDHGRLVRALVSNL